MRLVPRVRARLGNQRHTIQNIPSMPWREVPAFYDTLGDTPPELALRLLILTAARSTPVRLAREEHIEGDVWTVPASLMKNNAPFRIPLSDEALRVVEMARPFARDGFLFCALRGRPISTAVMSKYLDRRDLRYRPHGFRATFRTWAEETEEPWHLAETSLAHTVGNKVERTYQRADLLDLRRPLMQQWSDYVTGPRA